MKTLNVKVVIQFDQFSDEKSAHYAMSTIDRINDVLQREFSDISPSIFGNSIDDDDIEICDGDDGDVFQDQEEGWEYDADNKPKYLDDEE